MKYIKIFEKFNEYYQEISEEEYDDVIDDDDKKLEEFTKEEISILKKKFPTKKGSEKLAALSDEFILMIINGDREADVSNKNFGIYISKFEDEWFYVSYGSEYYKCDQFEGLLKVLEELIKF